MTQTDNQISSVSRRMFLQQLSIAGVGTLLVDRYALARDTQQALPRRVLGRTKQEVTTLALGTWPCGKSRDVGVNDIARLVQEAIDLGINFVDSARVYDNAEEGIGKGLGKRRDQVFLTTKVWADTADEAAKSLEESLRQLRTDHVDLVYLHSVGSRNVPRAMASGGAIEYLLRQKEKGTTRFIGISGHSRPKTFVPLLKTGHIDVLMPAMNFVDRHTYNFEQTVLPVAREHQVGVVCMKVFGGMQGGFAKASGPNPGPMVRKAMLQQAIRYSLGLPGVATVVIGPHTVEQLRENVKMVRNYTPLSDAEDQSLNQLGKKLAQTWGPHFGPVA